MNRRHMSGDHHGRTARRATPLVTAADEILGTHRSSLAWFEVCRHGVPIIRQHRHQRIISTHSAILPPKTRNAR